MRKTGFTLIELLAVIVILAIITLIAVPIVLHIINDSKEASMKERINMYGDSIKKAAMNYFLKYPKEQIVTFEKLEKEKLINLTNNEVKCNIVQIGEKGKIYLSDCIIDGIKVSYEYGTLINPIVDLPSELIPVIYDGNNWKVIDRYDPQWYNYNNQKWANAVVLSEAAKLSHKDQVGSIISVDGATPDALMMMVWIPRYEYKYTNLGNQYAGGSQIEPGAIDINFISKKIIEPSSGEYKIHPAFTFGEKELSGIRVGKFAISHTTKSQSTNSEDLDSILNCVDENCNEARNLRVLPDLSSLRYNNISNFYYAMRSIEARLDFVDIDTHMMKNSEWGAVAYLSQSKYGKKGNKDYFGQIKYSEYYTISNKEIYQNKSSEYKTGKSNGSAYGSINRSIQCKYNDMTDLGEGKGQCGPGASTTGNIYGIYDMSGVTHHLMGVYGGRQKKPRIESTGFSENTFLDNLIDKKYYDVYTDETYDMNLIGHGWCESGICYGHAIEETMGWQKDYTFNSFMHGAWASRGGSGVATYAGLYYMFFSKGYISNSYTSRVVFTNK